MNGSFSSFPKLRRHLLCHASNCELLLQSYGKNFSFRDGKQLHGHMATCGLLSQSSLLSSKLAAMYAISGNMNHARLLFDGDGMIFLKSQNAYMWNLMIRGYVLFGSPEAALSLYVEMLSFGQQPDNFTFPFLLKACKDLSLPQLGIQIHGQAVAAGFGYDPYVQNSLIAMYMKCRQRGEATLVFDMMCERTLVSWNTIISGNFHNKCCEEAMRVFDEMCCVGVEPDSATIVSLLPVCAYLNDLDRGREVHRLVKAKGFGEDIRVRNALVDMYAKCGSLEDARKVFEDGEKDVVSWTSMIGGYVLNGHAGEAFRLSRQLLYSRSIRPNSVTLATLLSACVRWSSPRKHGKCIHAYAVRRHGGLQLNVLVETALIDMYAKCGDLDLGYQVLMNSSRRRTVPWNAIISGYSQNGLAREAIVLFKQMQTEFVVSDVATIICLLPAYANLADLRQSRNIHGYLIKSGYSSPQSSIEVVTALIHIYTRSGSLDSARELFDSLHEKDVISWSAIIAGYGMHGCGKDVILLFNQMLQSGIKPNEITFTSMLYACSHAGLLAEGLHLFNSMVENFQMEPHVDHYACVVDLLGRTGHLKDAYDLIITMPYAPNHAVWGALLGACVMHEDVELGEVAARNLFELEPQNTGNYVLLANIYAAVGRWNDVEAMRTMMNERGLRKMPGCSSIGVVKTV